MHWQLVVIGELIEGATALFCVLRDKHPGRLLAGAVAGAGVMLAILAGLLAVARHQPPNLQWLQIAFAALGLTAGLITGTAFGAFAGAAAVALVQGPTPARSSSYVGAFVGLAVAVVPVVFLQATWPEEVREAVVIALLCQGLIAGTLLGRGIGMKHSF
ncbi:MAG: hypothetical protein N2512_12505 [Armatimonadetes bacterium]|nr:hypothetical protein [Armatimonadota bacterium]